MNKKISFLLCCFVWLIVHQLFAITPLVTNGTNMPFALTVPGNNSVIQFAMSANGQAFAVWINRTSENQIQGQFFNGTNWVNLQIDPTIIAITPTSSSPNILQIALGSNPKLAIDGSGNATLLFVNPFGQIVATRFSGATLANATILSTGTTNQSPSVAVNQLGTALAVWIQGTPYAVLSSTFLNIPGGNWTTPGALFLPFVPLINGTYPASFGLANNNVGVAIWVDKTGVILTEAFTVP